MTEHLHRVSPPLDYVPVTPPPRNAGNIWAWATAMAALVFIVAVIVTS